MEPLSLLNSSEGKKYLKKFHSCLFIIKYGGSALSDPKMMSFFLDDIANMFKHNIRIILVHGGGPHLSSEMHKHNMDVTFINGLRITTEKTVVMARNIFTQLNQTICDMLCQKDVIPISYADGTYIHATHLDNNIPGNRVGRVINISLSEPTIDYIPVVSSIGMDVAQYTEGLGTHLNINADHLAVQLGIYFQASKIIFLSDIDGIYLDIHKPDTKVSQVTEKDINHLIQKNILQGGMRLKVESALHAIKNGVSKVHFINGSVHHSILMEIFTDIGIGTEIVY